MPESKIIDIFWTNNALHNAYSIKSYLLQKFSDKEVEHFLSLLKSFEVSVSVFPKLYSISSARHGIRRAVLNNVLSVFYRIKKKKIEVLAILDNRCDIPKWLSH